MKRLARRLKITLFFVTTLLIAGLAAFGYLNSNYAKPEISRWAEKVLSQAIGFDVQIGKIEFTFPATLTLADVILIENTKPFIKAETIHLTISPAKILDRQLVISLAEVNHLELLALPGKNEDKESPLHSTPFSSPFPIEIQKFNLNCVKLSSSLLDTFNHLPDRFLEELSCIDIQGSIHLEKKNLLLSGLSFTTRQLSLNGHLAYETDTRHLEGEIKGECSDLSLASQLVGMPISGGASFCARFLPIEEQSPGISMEMVISSPAIAAGDISIFGIEVAGSFKAIQQTSSWEGRVHSSIGQFVLNDLVLNEIALTTEVDSKENSWPIIASIGSPFDSDSTDHTILQAEGQWSLNEEMAQLTVNRFEGAIYHTPFSLIQTASLTYSLGSLKTSLLDFHLNEGSIQTTFEKNGDSLMGSLRLIKIPLAISNFNSEPFPLQGFLSGEGVLRGDLTNPSINCDLSFDDVLLKKTPFADLPKLNGHCHITFSKNGLDFTGAIDPVDQFTMSAESHLPISFSAAPFGISVDQAAAITGSVKATAELITFAHLLPADTTTLNGKLEANATLFGTVSSPKIKAAATISEGSFESFIAGTLLNNIHADLESTESELKLISLQAADNKGGKLSASGTLSYDIKNQFPFSVSFDCNRLGLVDQDFIQGLFSGPLTLKGTFKQAELSGSLTSDSATLTLPEKSRAFADSLEVTYINQNNSEAAKIHKTSTLSSNSWPIHLDVLVNIPGNMNIVSADLTSTWKGELKITGTDDFPLLNGEFKANSGQYLFNGKDFEISQGMISLNGDITDKANTTLYIIASKDLDKLKAEVILKGAIKNPEISFRSNPPLPQREILSWILFGRGTSEISPFQGSQLSESITNLKHENTGPDVLTKVRNALGIDRFDISRDENKDNAVSLQVGKYVSKNVFVSVKKSDVNQVAVEATLLPNIKLQAQVGDDSEGQLLLKWKHDY